MFVIDEPRVRAPYFVVRGAPQNGGYMLPMSSYARLPVVLGSWKNRTYIAPWEENRLGDDVRDARFIGDLLVVKDLQKPVAFLLDDFPGKFRRPAVEAVAQELDKILNGHTTKA